MPNAEYDDLSALAKPYSAWVSALLVQLLRAMQEPLIRGTSNNNRLPRFFFSRFNAQRGSGAPKQMIYDETLFSFFMFIGDDLLFRKRIQRNNQHESRGQLYNHLA